MVVDDEIAYARERLHAEIDRKCVAAQLALLDEAIDASITILCRTAIRKHIDEIVSCKLFKQQHAVHN